MSGTWAAGWVAGDVVTAAEYAKGTGAIFNSTLGADAASFDITGIVATYAHLRIVAQLRGTEATASSNAAIRFNNDSSAIYDWERLFGNGAAAGAGEGLAATGGQIGFIPGSTVGAGIAATLEIVIPNYAGTTFNKGYTSTCNHKVGVASGNVYTGVWGGQWRSTAAINRITLVPQANNFLAGSRVTVYAMGS